MAHKTIFYDESVSLNSNPQETLSSVHTSYESNSFAETDYQKIKDHYTTLYNLGLVSKVDETIGKNSSRFLTITQETGEYVIKREYSLILD